MNFLALLGWAPDGETTIMSREELVERFTLERVGSSPATFDYAKLDWMNGVYLRALPVEEYAERLLVYLREQGIDWDRGSRPGCHSTRAGEDRATRRVSVIRRVPLPRRRSRPRAPRRARSRRCRESVERDGAVDGRRDRDDAEATLRRARREASDCVSPDPRGSDGVAGLTRPVREPRASWQGDVARAHPSRRADGDGWVSVLDDLVDVELGPTSWFDVTQERIDAFAAATDDSQWIHTDAERAAAGPFGSTIAHGFLTLSLCVPMLYEVLPATDGMVVNYGVNKVRFPAPVPTGSRIRGRFKVVGVEDAAHGRSCDDRGDRRVRGRRQASLRGRARDTCSVLTTPGAARHVCYRGQPHEPSPSTRRIRFAVALAIVGLLAGIAASSATALRFTDDSCFEVGIIRVCPEGVVGTSYSKQLNGAAGCEPHSRVQGQQRRAAARAFAVVERVYQRHAAQSGNYLFEVELRDVGPAEGGPDWCTNPKLAHREFTLKVLSGLSIETKSLQGKPATIGRRSLGVHSNAMLLTASNPPPARCDSPLTWSVLSRSASAGPHASPAGVITGTPTTAGSSTFVVRLRSTRRAETPRPHDRRHQPSRCTAPLRSLTFREVGVPFTAKLVATGGTGIYTWSLGGVRFPAGVAARSRRNAGWDADRRGAFRSLPRSRTAWAGPQL